MNERCFNERAEKWNCRARKAVSKMKKFGDSGGERFWGSKNKRKQSKPTHLEECARHMLGCQASLRKLLNKIPSQRDESDNFKIKRLEKEIKRLSQLVDDESEAKRIIIESKQARWQETNARLDQAESCNFKTGWIWG